MANNFIHSQVITILGRKAILAFFDGRPYHQLYLRLLMEDYGDRQELTHNIFRACSGMRQELAEMANKYFGKTSSSGLMPEARTYYPWTHGFLWEFWVSPAEVDCVALMNILEPENIAKKIEEYCNAHG